MSQSDSEEKTLQPTPHKLRKAREKGQTANSNDFIQALTTIAGIIFIVLNWKTFFHVFSDLFSLTVLSFGEKATDVGLGMFLTTLFQAMYAITPMVVMIILIGVVGNILDKQGIPFSLHPIKPDFKKINPAEGMKKLFKKRNWIEFSTALVKITIWFVLCGVLLWLFLQTILTSLYCSLGCIIDVSSQIGLIILVAAVILLLFTGLLDIPMQRFLFNDEQKMGHNEAKREYKETEGSPEFKSHRRSEYMNLVNGAETGEPGSGEISDGTQGMSLIIRGGDAAVGIYFDLEHANVPVVVKRFSGGRFVKDLQAAEKKQIPVFHDQTLVNDILTSVEEGSTIKERQFEKVARLLLNIGAF